LGVFRDETLVCECRLATDRTRTGDQYAIDLLALLRLYGIDEHGIDGAIISSVVPGLDKVLSDAVKRVTGVTSLLVGPGIKSGINIRIDNPAQLGADLLVGAVSAVAKYGAPCIVWDLGTATTVSVLDKSGAFCGGAIMPGVRTSLDSLSHAAALLPAVSIETPPQVIGTNTVDCMASGTVFGTASMIDGMSTRVEEELGYPAKTVVTGGLAAEIIPHCHREVIYDPTLLLEGLRLIYLKNQ
jgi:type III pantothenate kinase